MTSAIPGVTYLRHLRHEDHRGAFREIFRASALPGTSQGGATFVQANLSSSKRGVLRGLHFHRRQLDYWTVASGVAFIALVDVRALLDAPAGGRDEARPTIETRTLQPDDAVVIPAGVAHGFLALEDMELLYLVTAEYDGSDELGFAWDDPAVGIPWPSAPTPDGRPILSDRDRLSPALAEALSRVRS